LTPAWAPTLEPDFATVATIAGRSGECSGADADSDEASVAPKLEGAGDEGPVVVGAAGVAAGIGIAFTYIAVPRDRMHSIRQ